MPNLAAADRELSLTPQERDLYQRHLTNLTGPGGVDNPDGSRSSLKALTVESDGKTYTLAEVLKTRHAALVFYPGNNTPG